MSVFVTAFFPHSFDSFSLSVIERFAQQVPGDYKLKWRPDPTVTSPAHEFETYGVTGFFLPNKFVITFGRKMCCLKGNDRWSGFISSAENRDSFVGDARRVAGIANASEMMIAPEGFVIVDDFYSGVDFFQFKEAARREFGPPDLDIHEVYDESRRKELSDRIHYYLIDLGQTPQNVRRLL